MIDDKKETSRVTDSVAELFHRGHFREVVARTIDTASLTVRPAEVKYVVGSLVFLGRLEEASIYYQRRRGELDAVSLFGSRYFLGTGYTRIFDFARGRQFFGENARELRQGASEPVKMYAFLGLAFYRYWVGAFRVADEYVQRAYQAAFLADELYGRIVALDLMGHLQMARGDVRAGFRTFGECRLLAETTGALWVQTALGISVTLYRSNFGIAGRDAASELESQYAQFSLEDAYNRAAILLELARHRLLEGNWDEARDILERAAQDVYEAGNQRLEAVYGLRVAYLNYLAGDFDEAWRQVEAALAGLPGQALWGVELAALGLKERLARALARDEEASSASSRIATLTRRSGGWLATKILRRQERAEAVVQRPGQDPLGDLLDRVRSHHPNALQDVLKSGYLSFLHELLGIRPGSRAIACLSAGEQGLVLFDRGRVAVQSHRIAALPQKLLRCWAQSPNATKEAICHAVWGQAYHPLRFDPLIYSLIAKIRRFHPWLADWIQVSEEGYSLAEGVTILFPATTVTRTSTAVSVAPVEGLPPSEARPIATQPARAEVDPHLMQGLNPRQVELVTTLPARQWVDVQSYREKFQVSAATASRDLADLVSRGLLARIGNARATRYVRSEPT